MWVEIEGLPYAYGTRTKDASYFSTRATKDQLLGMKAYLTGKPKTMSQTIDTLNGGALTAGAMNIDILDKNDEIALLTNLQTPLVYDLDAAVAKTDTTILLNDITGLVIGSILYIGTETIKVGGVTNTPSPRVTSCTRAMWGSVAQAFPARFPVGTQPWVMASRRAVVYQTFQSFTSTTGGADADKVRRFAGVCRGFALKPEDRNIFTLTVESVDKELDRPCFRRFRSFRLVGSTIKDGEGNNGNTQVIGWPGYYPNYDEIANIDIAGGFGGGTLFADDEQVLVRIDSEIFALQFDLTTNPHIPRARMMARALYNTKPEAHAEGALIQEIVPVIARGIGPSGTGPNQNWAQQTSKFGPIGSAVVPDDHPIAIVLQLLLSTGEGLNFPGSGPNYDQLPEEWGMAHPYERVDFDGIHQAMREDPALRFGGLVEEPQNFVALMRELLAFAGYYYFTTTENKFTIRKLRPPYPDAPPQVLNNARFIRNRPPTWDANWKGAVRELVFKFGYDYIDKKFKRITILRINDADIYTKGLAQTKTYESRFIDPGGTSIPGGSPIRPQDIDAWLLQRQDFYRIRFGKPPPIVTVALDYALMGLELGELVSLTDVNLPNVSGGTRGVADGIYEITGKEIDDQNKTVRLTLLGTGFQLGDYRYISPSFVILAGKLTDEGGDEWTISDLDGTSQFIDPAIGTDGHMVIPGSQTDYFIGFNQVSASPSVIVWSEDWQNYIQAAVVDGDGSFLRIYFSAGTPVWFDEGCVITVTPLDDTDANKPFWCYAPSGGTPIHRLFPL